jgi:hypothetical protein
MIWKMGILIPLIRERIEGRRDLDDMVLGYEYKNKDKSFVK